MPFVWVFLVELIFLAILTRHAAASFLRLFYFISQSEKVSVILFALVFFPGTFIHELAHFLMARLLFVSSSKMEFLPQIQADVIKLGSVSITPTDPFRRTLIGVAPVIVGLLTVLGGIGLLTSYTNSWPWWAWGGAGYLVFVISSTMFSSKKDMEGSIWVLLTFMVVLTIIYFVGFGWILIRVYSYLINELNNFFKQLSLLMLTPLVINGLIGLLGRLQR